MYEHKLRVDRPYANTYVVNKGTEFEYIRGEYIFKDGIVNFNYDKKYAHFVFVYKGRQHFLIEEINGNCSNHKIKIKAGKFGKKIVAEYDRK